MNTIEFLLKNNICFAIARYNLSLFEYLEEMIIVILEEDFREYKLQGFEKAHNQFVYCKELSQEDYHYFNQNRDLFNIKNNDSLGTIYELNGNSLQEKFHKIEIQMFDNKKHFDKWTERNCSKCRFSIIHDKICDLFVFLYDNRYRALYKDVRYVLLSKKNKILYTCPNFKKKFKKK